MSNIIKIQLLCFILIALPSCKIGNLGSFSIMPETDTHMHGPGTVPHSHSHRHKGDHVHNYRCDYKNGTYMSTKSCGTKFKHMHGPDAPPHEHYTTDSNHVAQFQCQYKGDETIYRSDKDCGLHTHKHLHTGLTVTADDPHGLLTEGAHQHNHEHTGEHAHNDEEMDNFCYTKQGYVQTPVPCIPKNDHVHVHMHNSNEAPHSHPHDHKNEHGHANMQEFCVGTGNDHKYYTAPNGSCSFKHKHVIMIGYGTEPRVTEHRHKKDITLLKSQAHPYTCTSEGKTYQSSDTCNKPHTHEHSHYDDKTKKRYKHVHEHIFADRSFHHPAKEDVAFK